MNREPNKGRRYLLCLALFALAACTTPQYETVNRDVMDDIQGTLETASAGNTAAGTVEQPPENVLQALVPGLTLSSETLQPIEERFDFAVQEPMEAREFFSLLTEGTDYSVVVHPSVNGTISALNLKNVTLQEALDQISALYGYSINRSGSIYQIMPGGLETRIFKVNYLNVNRSGTSTMSVVSSGLNSGGGNGNGNNNNNNNNGNNNNGFGNNGNNNSNSNSGFGNNNGNNSNGNNGNNGTGSGGSSGGANISTRSTSDYWRELETMIKSIIGSSEVANTAATGLLDSLTSSAGPASSNRAVIISPQTGMIVVRAYPAELDRVADFLAQSQDALQRQVVLEAKILEVTLNERFQAGIDLQMLETINTDDPVGVRSSFLNEATAFDEEGNALPVPIGGIPQALQLAYDASNFDGVIRLLETQGNVQVISSPRITTLNNQKAVFKVGDEEYFSTNQSTTTTTGGNSTVQNSNVSLQPFFSGIALDVTPQISDEGDIILHIHPLLNAVVEDLKVIGGDTLTLPKSDTRESDSIARARNGEVIIISGLMQTRARGSEAGIPGARDVPVIGNAFERTQRDTEKTELVILLRAIVDEGTNMRDVINEHTESVGELRQRIDEYFR